MRQKLLALTAIAAAGVGAAGCGSSSSSTGSSGSSNSGLSYSAFTTAADQICVKVTASLLSLKSVHATSYAQAVGPLNNAAGGVADAITQLQALQGPPVLTSARDIYVADLQQANTDLKNAANAAQAKNPQGLKSAGLALSALVSKVNVDGAKLGPHCSK